MYSKGEKARVISKAKQVETGSASVVEGRARVIFTVEEGNAAFSRSIVDRSKMRSQLKVEFMKIILISEEIK